MDLIDIGITDTEGVIITIVATEDIGIEVTKDVWNMNMILDAMITADEDTV